jgi:hypothetical protein
MHTSPAISYELAQARIADLRHQARRASLARAAQSPAAQSEPQPRKPGVSGRLHLRAAGRHRVTTAIG